MYLYLIDSESVPRNISFHHLKSFNHYFCVGAGQNYVIFECKIDLYLIGDLKFLFMVMGQSGYSAHYCLYCRLKSAQWRTIYKNQKKINCEADFWSIQSLTQEALMIQQGNSNKVGMGIKEPPIWDFIPVHKILVPILHILLGLGNDVLAKFLQWVDEQVEFKSEELIAAQHSLMLAEISTEACQDSLKTIDSDLSSAVQRRIALNKLLRVRDLEQDKKFGYRQIKKAY